MDNQPIRDTLLGRLQMRGYTELIADYCQTVDLLANLVEIVLYQQAMIGRLFDLFDLPALPAGPQVAAAYRLVVRGEKEL